jgi:DNA polymerase II small subunit/DNA polymerase delta subunit B|tara:strand:- start:31 stop:447 length:417 start_codon:yes stop_codon:yes gene_type:complete
MAFGLGRLAVLESKLDIYEDLSKEMLDKLERAVGTISENSNRVAVILERHENRLDESERADKLIIGMLEEMKERHEKDMLMLHERIGKVQKKTESNTRFVIATSAVLTTLVTVLQVFPPVFKLLTPQVNAAIIGPANP